MSLGTRSMHPYHTCNWPNTGCFPRAMRKSAAHLPRTHLEVVKRLLAGIRRRRRLWHRHWAARTEVELELVCIPTRQGANEPNHPTV